MRSLTAGLAASFLWAEEVAASYGTGALGGAYIRQAPNRIRDIVAGLPLPGLASEQRPLTCHVKTSSATNLSESLCGLQDVAMN